MKENRKTALALREKARKEKSLDIMRQACEVVLESDSEFEQEQLMPFWMEWQDMK